MKWSELIKRTKQMQEALKKAQEELANLEVTGSAGGGMVELTLNGQGALVRVKIEEEFFKEGDVALLEDMIVAAHSDARRRLQEEVAQRLGQLGGEIDLSDILGGGDVRA